MAQGLRSLRWRAAISIVGALLVFGWVTASGQRVTGFRVEPGEHVVRVRHDECEGVPERIQLGPGSIRLVVLTADVDEGYDCRVVLR